MCDHLVLLAGDQIPDDERALARGAARQAVDVDGGAGRVGLHRHRAARPRLEPRIGDHEDERATGERNFRQSRRDFEALPFASDACAALAETVEAERRADLTVDAPSLTMLPDGRLASDFGSLPLSERTLEGLGRLVTPGGAG